MPYPDESLHGCHYPQLPWHPDAWAEAQVAYEADLPALIREKESLLRHYPEAHPPRRNGIMATLRGWLNPSIQTDIAAPAQQAWEAEKERLYELSQQAWLHYLPVMRLKDGQSTPLEQLPSQPLSQNKIETNRAVAWAALADVMTSRWLYRELQHISLSPQQVEAQGIHFPQRDEKRYDAAYNILGSIIRHNVNGYAGEREGPKFFISHRFWDYDPAIPIDIDASAVGLPQVNRILHRVAVAEELAAQAGLHPLPMVSA